jgi:hypothetical protein
MEEEEKIDFFQGDYDDISYSDDINFNYNDSIVAPEFLQKFGIVRIKPGIPEELQEYFSKFRCKQTSKECSICQQSFQFNDLMAKVPCGHFFHDPCIKR